MFQIWNDLTYDSFAYPFNVRWLGSMMTLIDMTERRLCMQWFVIWTPKLPRQEALWNSILVVIAVNHNWSVLGDYFVYVNYSHIHTYIHKEQMLHSIAQFDPVDLIWDTWWILCATFEVMRGTDRSKFIVVWEDTVTLNESNCFKSIIFIPGHFQQIL